MKTGLKIEQIWYDEHIDEILIEVTAKNIWVNISYYSNIENLKELSTLINCFIENLKPFEWNDGDNFKVKVYPHDRRGHIQVDFFLRNMQTGYLDDSVYCECSLTFELGQIEKLSKQILNFIKTENYSIEIEAMD